MLRLRVSAALTVLSKGIKDAAGAGLGRAGQRRHAGQTAPCAACRGGPARRAGTPAAPGRADRGARAPGGLAGAGPGQPQPHRVPPGHWLVGCGRALSSAACPADAPELDPRAPASVHMPVLWLLGAAHSMHPAPFTWTAACFFGQLLVYLDSCLFTWTAAWVTYLELVLH